MMKYLGVDWGEKRIGLALGDSETKISTPFKTIENQAEIFDVIKEEGIDEIVLGEPFKMGGQEQELDHRFLDFFEYLKSNCQISIHLVDERLSSKAADSLAGDKKTKAGRDAIAAMLILETFLNKLKA